MSGHLVEPDSVQVQLEKKGIKAIAALLAKRVRCRSIYEEEGFIQAQTPGARDVLVFEKNAEPAGPAGGVIPFGFRLVDAADIKRALQTVEAAGGAILSHGELCPGEPYLFCRDPDGYELEIWYELPTPIDPPTA